MDNQPTPQVTIPEAPQSPKKNIRKGFLFFEIGLFEIGFVTILLIIIFGVLNYFHILRLSSQIPQLSFLPTKPTPTPVPIPISIVNETLIKYIQKTVRSSFLPSGIQNLRIEKNPEGYQASWTEKNAKFKALSAYDPYRTQLQYMKIATALSLPPDQVSSNSSRLIATTFFNSSVINGIWSCGPLLMKNAQGLLCSSSLSNSADKEGIAVEAITIATSSATSVLSCYIPSQSTMSEATSCATLGL